MFATKNDIYSFEIFMKFTEYQHYNVSPVAVKLIDFGLSIF